MGYETILPNFYDSPMIEEKIKKEQTKKEHIEFCRRSFVESRKKAQISDATLILNFDKIKDHKIYENYIGGATFLEMYDSYLLNHPIFLYNPIPEGMLYDEVEGMNPIFLNGNLLKVKYYLENHFSNYLDYDDYIKIKECDDLYLKSACLVRILFQNKHDKSGEPYIGHLFRVSNQMTTLEGQVAGLLHDVVEDIKEITFEDLISIGIPSSIIETLKLVTKEKQERKLSKEEKLEKYNQEINHIIESKNNLALELKIADMSDNYNPERLEKCPIEMKDWFQQKYENNLLKLKEAKEKRKILC